MYIIYTDGGVLECSTVVVDGACLIADDIYEVPIGEIDRIYSIEE